MSKLYVIGMGIVNGPVTKFATQKGIMFCKFNALFQDEFTRFYSDVIIKESDFPDLSDRDVFFVHGTFSTRKNQYGKYEHRIYAYELRKAMGSITKEPVFESNIEDNQLTDEITLDDLDYQ